MKTLNAVRARENEERFARANAEIIEKAETLEMGSHPVPFLCECSDLRCTGIIQLSLHDYRTARSRRPGAFMLLPGHDDEYVEHVVAEADEFVLVKKRGRAA